MAYYHNSIFKLYLKKSQIPDSGIGVYTPDIINANTLIDSYNGDYSKTAGGSYVLMIDDDISIDAFNHPRCYMAMINDCSFIPKKIIKKNKKKIDVTPTAYYDNNNNKLEINCEFVIDKINKKAYVYSIKEIKENSELFISYGTGYW